MPSFFFFIDAPFLFENHVYFLQLKTQASCTSIEPEMQFQLLLRSQKKSLVPNNILDLRKWGATREHWCPPTLPQPKLSHDLAHLGGLKSASCRSEFSAGRGARSLTKGYCKEGKISVARENIPWWFKVILSLSLVHARRPSSVWRAKTPNFTGT